MSRGANKNVCLEQGIPLNIPNICTKFLGSIRKNLPGWRNMEFYILAASGHPCGYNYQGNLVPDFIINI